MEVKNSSMSIKKKKKEKTNKQTRKVGKSPIKNNGRNIINV